MSDGESTFLGFVIFLGTCLLLATAGWHFGYDKGQQDALDGKQKFIKSTQEVYIEKREAK